MIPSARAARIAKEIKNFETKPPWGIFCQPRDDVCDLLQFTLQGPKGSPYENGTFKLSVTIPQKYPLEPPLLKFITPVYHPNIDKGGRICMDMLKMPPIGAWLPTITLETLLVSLQTLLANPNPDDPLMMDIANEYKYNKDCYSENARRHTEKYAKGTECPEAYKLAVAASIANSKPADNEDHQDFKHDTRALSKIVTTVSIETLQPSTSKTREWLRRKEYSCSESNNNEKPSISRDDNLIQIGRVKRRHSSSEAQSINYSDDSSTNTGYNESNNNERPSISRDDISKEIGRKFKRTRHSSKIEILSYCDDSSTDTS